MTGRMAAAPGVGIGAFPLASPELALVDAHLAAELRQSLHPVEDSWLRPRQRSEEAPDAGSAASPEPMVEGAPVARFDVTE